MSAPDVDPNASYAKIVLWRTIGISYAEWFRRFPDVMRATIFWIALLAIMMGIAHWLNWSIAVSLTADLKSSSLRDPPFRIVNIALYVCAAIVFIVAVMDVAVTWHRCVILNENPELFGRTIARSYFWRYFGRFLLILFVATAPLNVLLALIAFDIDFEIPFENDLVAPAAGFVILLAMYVIFVRLSFVLAAEAIEAARLTWAQSLKLTRGNALRLVVGLFVCTFVPGLMIEVLLECVGLADNEMSPIEVLLKTGTSDAFLRQAVRQQIVVVVALVTLPIGIEFLSRSYQRLAPRMPSEHRSMT